jgi:TfoX/Sxy family transcriptional regulator of competence genes
MAYDEAMAERIREHFGVAPDVDERRMFGGLCFMVRGHMACGIANDSLMVRVGPDDYEAALAEPRAGEMDFTGRPLRGMVYVSAEGVATAKSLGAWIERGAAFARSLPRKAARKKPGRGGNHEAFVTDSSTLARERPAPSWAAWLAWRGHPDRRAQRRLGSPGELAPGAGPTDDLGVDPPHSLLEVRGPAAAGGRRWTSIPEVARQFPETARPADRTRLEVRSPAPGRRA